MRHMHTSLVIMGFIIAMLTNFADAAPPVQGNQDETLMAQMSATYYSFTSSGVGRTGGTERRVVLCPDGTYYTGTESGYSSGAGTGGAWGTASRKGGHGTWGVVGNVQKGTLTTITSDGKPTQYHYQSCGKGCYFFGNNKFAVEGPARCR